MHFSVRWWEGAVLDIPEPKTYFVTGWRANNLAIPLPSSVNLSIDSEQTASVYEQ